jgi:DNA-directed RNA polymerase specialized sigma24 family protein
VSTDLDVHWREIAAGHARAFGRWMAGAERPMRESLRSFATRVDVEAVLQEALLRTWQVAPRLEPDGRPNALLRMALRIARNLAIDEARSASRSRTDDDATLDALEAPAPALPDPLLARAIQDCRAALPAKPAAALEARLEAQGAVPDVRLADRLGMQLNTFLQNFTRARKLLAQCLALRGIEVPE